MNRQDIRNEVLYLSKDARHQSFNVVDIINALTTTGLVVLNSSDTLDTDVPVQSSYINKVNNRIICVDYATRKSYSIATITVRDAN